MRRAMRSSLLGFAALAGLLVLLDMRAAGDEKKADKGTVVEIDGQKSQTPASWVEEKPTSKLRVKQFRLPKVGEDKDDAVMLIIFLDGSGGSSDENVKRWQGQFKPPAGKSIDDVSKIEKLTVGNAKATYVDVHGTYVPPPFEKSPPKPDYRMLAIYWDSKNGPYFFRLTGPAKTVEHYKKGYDEWVKGFK